jgi:hypothetical protein
VSTGDTGMPLSDFPSQGKNYNMSSNNIIPSDDIMLSDDRLPGA